MIYQEFEELYFNELPNKDTHLRSGQFLMFLLSNIWRNEYERILNKEDGLKTIDCFYNDRLIPNTLNHLKNVWNKYPE